LKLLLILAGFFSLVCPLQGQNSKLPVTRPPDFSLTRHLDGGMRNYSEALFISKDSCIYSKNDEGKRIRKRFVLSNTEMDALYAMLKKNRFDEIEYRTEKEVYDRGGININASWDHDKKQLEVSDAQRSFVKPDWEKEWEAVCSWLEDLVKKKTK
jgi:hypothetical protein